MADIPASAAPVDLASALSARIRGIGTSPIGLVADRGRDDPEVVKLSGKTHHPILLATGNPADTVSGTVFLITPEELAQADKYEVSDYRRVLAPLASGGSAWAYVAQESSTDGA